VDPVVQRTGAGRALLGALLYEAEGCDVFLEVRVDNEPAIRLYEAEGFEKVSVRKNYYRRVGKDAVVMRRPAELGGGA
jgi:ribosomal-protein-alanine N-acetyltransferase